VSFGFATRDQAAKRSSDRTENDSATIRFVPGAEIAAAQESERIRLARTLMRLAARDPVPTLTGVSRARRARPAREQGAGLCLYTIGRTHRNSEKFRGAAPFMTSLSPVCDRDELLERLFHRLEARLFQEALTLLAVARSVFELVGIECDQNV
jgi:hypothetical protein